MLTLRRDTEGIWVKHKVRGSEIELKIRPFTNEDGERIRKRHKRTEYVKDSQTRQMVKTEIVADDEVFEDMLDYIIEDFKGIGYSEAEPLPVTKENKKKLALLPVGNGEQPLSEFIIEKAREFAVVDEEAAQAEIKN